MKTIGLIGGMSWESSVVYYELINKEVKRRLGGHHSCQCLMYSVDFAEIELLQHQGDWEGLTRIMIDAAQRLERGGADFVVICTNTMHKMAPEVGESLGIPLLHIVDAVAREIIGLGMNRVALLGTRFTMEQEFYRGRLVENHGIDVIIPAPSGIETVHRIIYNELVHGVLRDESRREFLAIIGDLVARGAQGVILGCTEIPLLIRQTDCSVPLFDSTRIHALAAVDMVC